VGNEPNQWQIEQEFRNRMTEWYQTEIRAYSCLRSLQGLHIPKYLETVTFDNDQLDAMPAGIFTEVRGIVLEFIDGVPLDTITPESAMAVKNPQIGQAAVVCFEK
jgi:hypothetical protein